MTYRSPLHPETHPARIAAREQCCAFLRDRAHEELARLWGRDTTAPDRPGLAAQVAVLDDLLTTVSRGDLPAAWELRILLYGYGRHADYDPTWTDLIPA